MAKQKKFPRVPNFTPSAIHLADLCAREIWRGVNYVNGDKITVVDKDLVSENRSKHVSSADFVVMSDEEFLVRFAEPFLNIAYDDEIKIKKPISALDVQHLIEVARLRFAQIKTQHLDVESGIEVLLSFIAQHYRDWNAADSELNYSEIGGHITVIMGDAFFKPADELTLGTQHALASRLLFFAIPDMPLFNYSGDIADGLDLKGNSEELIKRYIDTLSEGYDRNWHLLSQYQMPYPIKLNDKVWERARDAGWWQRRIYDLALKFHYKDTKNSKEATIIVNNFVKKLFYTAPLKHL